VMWRRAGDDRDRRVVLADAAGASAYCNSCRGLAYCCVKSGYARPEGFRVIDIGKDG